MTKGIKCDGPDCNEFVVGEPIGSEGWWLRLEILNRGEYSYHFHVLDCLINWAKLEKGGEEEIPELPPSDEGELLEMESGDTTFCLIHKWSKWSYPYDSHAVRTRGGFGDTSTDDVIRQMRQCERCRLVQTCIISGGCVDNDFGEAGANLFSSEPEPLPDPPEPSQAIKGT